MGELKDAVEAWTCAANLRLYDGDPGPRRVNVGSAVEPRWVDRYDALVDLYARQMLVQLDADPERLIVAPRECRVRAREQRQWWTGGIPARRHLRQAVAWREWVATLTPWARRDLART